MYFSKLKIIVFTFLLLANSVASQTDFSGSWEDFYSYNNVKDFVKVNTVMYALVDNAVFTYNLSTKEVQKISSVVGLSGETTTAIHYSASTNRLVIGYETGLIEVIDENGKITISADIVNFNQSGNKRINDIYEFNNKLYVATPFAIVVYDIQQLEFGDTFFIGAGSTSLQINETTVFNNTIYAATEEGVYTADVTNTALIDFNNWTQSSTGNYTQIISFNNQVYASRANQFINVSNSFTVEKTFSGNILSLKKTIGNLTIGLAKEALVYNNSLTQVLHNTASSTDYNLNIALAENNELFLGTKEHGILKSSFSSSQNFEEIHPDGPLFNTIFSVTAKEDNLWVVYGGYNESYVPLVTRKGFSHYKNAIWINTPFNESFPLQDLVQTTIDPNNINRVFISSFTETFDVNTVSTGGLLEIEDDVIKAFYNHTNTGSDGLEDFAFSNPNYATVRVSGSAFDSQGNLWVTNSLVNNNLKKFSANQQWSSVDLSSLQTNKASELNKIIVDKINNVWIGTRRNGVYVYNENGDRKRALTTEATKGSLPHANVRTVAADNNNRIWLGTQSGMVVFNNASGVFDATIYDAEPIIILDDGIPKKLLGDQTINTIAVDGADNKWFGTDTGGVLYTNTNGQRTLASFNTSNSPLPSNRILDISVDKSTGKVYFVTDKGMVAYNSKVSPFGDTLGEVYAYPNPALKTHNTVTIDGRNGTHLPKGTNVKILDVAGNLVYESNVVEGQELQGGKVVWDKTNLRGKKVASGIYIVLLSNEDGSESSSTKIAIVN